ncbi:DUF2236 domain-containing protein [Parahaliea maris]|uniref:DUF2236 domain-containing protein n=1 Tax=Parahaliea maris TaxID=2716870 RepID=A0A5C9A473_9GAMM|nr:oxygenase MpaB family protein [Parahaliea maris]TXS95568.1 DUF2236 domain-containing protein [Parahaliea maris]
MQSPYPDSVLAQRQLIPEIYGKVDFSLVPERFTAEPDAESAIRREYRARRGALLADSATVKLIRDYTMMGDKVADAYAALIPQYGFRTLVSLLEAACDKGLDALSSPPVELVTFIRSMEEKPAWLDMSLVEEGAFEERNAFVNLGPYTIRGAFIATFMNKYSALPMAMTGALSGELSAKRVFETATFFGATILPGALDRYGEGFKAAAKVRLMHSMVRFHALRSERWDVATYGIPIPQVDQMPAGLISIYLLSMKVLGEGRKTFSASERARLELSRYRCFLLGLPEELLGETPEDIVRLMMTRNATLRAGFDDATCGELVRATMAADLRRNPSQWGAVSNRLEQGFSKYFFVKNFCDDDFARARRIGVTLSPGDWLAVVLTALLIFGKLRLYRLALEIPPLRAVAGRSLLRRLRLLLSRWGRAEFVTDASSYREPADPAPRVSSQE